ADLRAKVVDFLGGRGLGHGRASTEGGCCFAEMSLRPKGPGEKGTTPAVLPQKRRGRLPTGGPSASPFQVHSSHTLVHSKPHFDACQPRLDTRQPRSIPRGKQVLL